MHRHVALVALIYGLQGLLGIFLGLFFVLFGFGAGAVAALEGEGALAAVAAFLGGGFGMLIIGTAALNALAAVGLLGRKTWGRILGILVSVLHVLSFSFWSLLGIYGLWALMSARSSEVFKG